MATKSDLDRVSQRNEVQPDVYCRDLMLSGPIAVSAKDGRLADLFQNIISVCLNPSIGLPSLETTRYRKRLVSSAAIVGASVVLLTSIALAYRFTRK